MEDPRESNRLASKVDSERFVTDYIKSVMVPKGDVLDVGCGPGVIARSIGQIFPESHVTALDISPKRLEEVEKNISGMSNVSTRQGDVYSLPFESDRFDLVFARFLFEFLKEPEKALTEMIRVCRPGGRVLLQDLDGQILWHYPEDSGLQSKINTIIEYLNRHTGFDPYIGRKLYHFLYSAGLKDIQVKAESYHLFPGRIDEKNYHLWEMKLDILMPHIEKLSGSEQEAIRWKKNYLDYLLREDTLTYSVVFTVSGEKPE